MSDNDELRNKRTKTLLIVWKFLDNSGKFGKNELSLNPILVKEVIEHYVNDVCILKMRYRIEGKIQVHKIAGLMASSIVKYRPIIPLNDNLSRVEYLQANEILAIFHGLFVCAEFSNPEILNDFLSDPLYQEWIERFVYLLHDRNSTTEGLIFIFDTLSRSLFPESFETK